MTYKINTIIEKDAHGYYAYAPELKGCQTQGETLEEVMSNIKEAIELYLESLSDEDKNNCLSSEIFTTSLVVNVA